MLDRSPFSFRHLLTVLPALAIGSLLWSNGGTADVGNSLNKVLPLILFCLGSGLCLLYGRIRSLCLLAGLYLALLILQPGLMVYQRDGVLSAHMPLIFHSVALWLPLWFGGMGLWPEQGHPHKDLLRRAIVLLCFAGPFLLLAFQDPAGMTRLISDTHVAALSWGGSRLAQLPAWLFLLSGGALLWHARRHCRPTTACAVIVLASCYVMLPWVFHWPALAVVVPVMGMVALITAVVQEAFDLAFRDDLTGLPGRRALNQAMGRLGGQYTLAMVDVDHFKKFNDTHGHDAGDDVLKLVAAQLAQVGGHGRAYRYGGEEFTLLFATADARQAREAIEAVRQAIADCRMQLRDRSARGRDDVSGQQRRGQGGRGPIVQVTVSIGVADHRAGATPEAVIKAADKALYAAKEAGRNCVRLHGQRTVAEITGSDRR